MTTCRVSYCDRPCWSCRKQPAEYLWIAAPSGNRVPLCAKCCGMWRLNAREEPGLAPETIKDLDGHVAGEVVNEEAL